MSFWFLFIDSNDELCCYHGFKLYLFDFAWFVSEFTTGFYRNIQNNQIIMRNKKLTIFKILFDRNSSLTLPDGASGMGIKKGQGF